MTTKVMCGIFAYMGTSISAGDIDVEYMNTSKRGPDNNILKTSVIHNEIFSNKSSSNYKELVDELANGSPRIMVAPPEDPNAHLKKSDITASGYGTQSDSHPHFMIGVTELNDDQVKQIGDRIKEILS